MIKREKKTKFRGSVLLTVVCVMSLLIVFLFGTLTLATAANNRAHMNYSSAQTDVTSRIVVDSAIKAISANDAYGSFIGNIGEDGKETVNVTLGDSVPNRGRYGKIAPVTVEWAGTKTYYDPVNKEWNEDGGVLKFTSTVSMGGVDSTTSAYVVKQPAGGENPGPGAGFVTVAGARLAANPAAYGGSYIGIPTEYISNDIDYTYKDRQYQENYWEIPDDPLDAKYEKSKPYYRHFAPYSDTNAFVLQNGAAIEADLYVNHNVKSPTGRTIVFPDYGKGVTIWGDCNIGNSGLKFIAPNLEEKTEIKFTEIPYIYVDGKLFSSSQSEIKFGDGSYLLNVFCGSIDMAIPVIYGDLYCMNPAETSYFGGADGTILHKWYDSVINKFESEGRNLSGNIYSKGNLVLKKATVEGDVCVEGDLTIDENVKIKGNVVVGGRLTIKDNNFEIKAGKNLYCKAELANIPNSTIEKDNVNFEEVSTFDEVKDCQYFKYDIKQHLVTVQVDAYNSKSFYSGLLGEEFTWEVDQGLTTLYYKWKKGFDPQGKYTEDAWANKDDLLNSIDVLAGIDKKYVDKYEYINSDNYQEICKYKPNADGSNSGESMEEFISSHPDYGYSNSSSYVVYDKSGNIVPFGSNITSSKIDNKYNHAGYKSDIYPDYAEREAILNLKEEQTSNGTVRLVPDKEDKNGTQIVKRFDQILASTVNPYKTLPNDLANYLKDNKKETLPEYTDIEQLSKDAEGNYIIDSDCVLNFKTGTNATRNLLIKPASGKKDVTFNIIIKKFELQGSGSKLILDDVSGNNAANIYISENSTLHLQTGSFITTKKYENFFDSCSQTIGYNSSSIVGKENDLAEQVGAPNINIYGGENSFMHSEGGAFKYIAANITSQHLKFKVDSVGELKRNNGDKINSIYYNGVEIKDPQTCVFGCLNVKDAEIQNNFNVVYVTDGNGRKKVTSKGFDYRVLYYDEY